MNITEQKEILQVIAGFLLSVSAKLMPQQEPQQLQEQPQPSLRHHDG